MGAREEGKRDLGVMVGGGGLPGLATLAMCREVPIPFGSWPSLLLAAGTGCDPNREAEVYTRQSCTPSLTEAPQDASRSLQMEALGCLC